MENLETALSLLLIGMLTVFAVLALIVVSGKLMIILVNKFTKESIIPEPFNQSNKQAISSNTLAAITSAISIITNGKGQVKEIIKH